MRIIASIALLGSLLMTGCSHSPSSTLPVRVSDRPHSGVQTPRHEGTLARQKQPRLLVLDFVSTDQKVFAFLPELANDPQRQPRLQHHFLDTRLGRATVLGADWLSTDLQQFPGWIVIDRLPWEAQLHHLQSRSDLEQLVQGAKPDILIISTVEDLGLRQSDFSGYGLDTSAKRFELHLFVRAVDAHNFKILASGEYEGESSTSESDNGQSSDSGRIRSLMRQAALAASQDLIARLGPSPN